MKSQTLYIDRFTLVSSLVVTSELQFEHTALRKDALSQHRTHAHAHTDTRARAHGHTSTHGVEHGMSGYIDGSR